MLSRQALWPFFLLAAASAFGQYNGDYTDSVAQGQWKTYRVKAEDWQNTLRATLTQQSGSPELYVRYGATPTTSQWDFHVSASGGIEDLTVDAAAKPALASGVYFLSVYGKTAGKYHFRFDTAARASKHSGFGAISYSGGTTFRVWAPFATQVTVAGSFNGWDTTKALLVREPGGDWSLDYRGVVPGQQYKFVVRNGSNTFWKNDPRARSLTNSAGNSIVYDGAAYTWTANGFVMPTWNDLVVYELHIGTFNRTGSGVGTFAMAEQKLDSLKDLGVNAIEVMPVAEFPGDSSWGYNPSYPFSVESAYGGPDAFKHFVDAAHARGIAVILDVVHNHYGPDDLDMWQFDGWSQNGWGGIYFYADERAVTPWGNTRPDYGRPEVQQYIRDNQSQWLNEFRLDGLRWDSVIDMHTTNLGDDANGWGLLEALNGDLSAGQPWKLNVAEDMQGNAWITKPTSQGGAGFGTQWSTFVHAVRPVLENTSDDARDMNAIAGALTEKFNTDVFQRVIYTESHDEDANGGARLPSEIDSGDPGSYWSRKRSTLGAALALTAPGIPMLFQGQEFLESGSFSDATPLDWSKATKYAGIRQLYKDLIALRKNAAGHSLGLTGQNLNLFHLDNTNKVVAYHRWMNGGSGDDVVVVLNFANTTWTNYRIGLPRTGKWTVAFDSDLQTYSSDYGNLTCPNPTGDDVPYDGLPTSAVVHLAPYSVLILTKD